MNQKPSGTGQQIAPVLATIDEAITHHTAGRLTEAESIYTQILQIQPDHPDALHLLGVVAHQVGKHEIAVNLIKRALTFRPLFPEAHCNLGNTLTALNKLDQAEENYQIAIKIKPDYVEAHFSLGNIRSEQQRLEEAVENYQTALTLKPDHIATINGLGIAMRKLHKFDEAVLEFKKAISLAPELAEAHNNLGTTLKALGKLDDAVVCYQQAISVNPKYVTAFYNLGLLYQDQKEFDLAIESLTQAVAINPEFAEAYNDLGITYLALNQMEQAIKCFQQAINEKPDFPDAHYNIGQVLRKQACFTEAIARYQTATAQNPDHTAAHNALGLTYLELGQMDDAILSFKRALSVDPKCADAAYNIGISLYHQGNLQESVAFLQQAFSGRTGIQADGSHEVSPALNALFLELTNKCNFHCSFCPSDSQKRTLGFMEVEFAMKMYTEVADKQIVDYVSLHLMGEPTLHPQLIEILKFGASTNVKTELVTNGSTLVPKVVPKILDALYGTLVASHMTPTKDTYRFRGKVGLSWDRYIGNIQLLVREYLKRLANGNEAQNDINLRIMITKDTASNVNIVESSQQALDILKEWSDYTAELEQEFGLPVFNRRQPNTDPLFQRGQSPIKRYHLQRGVALTFWEAFTFANTRVNDEFELKAAEKTIFCQHPFTDFGILWNGDVTLCCLDYDGQLKVGNVREDSIETVVNSEAANQLRASMLGQHPLPPVCQTCQARPTRKV